MRKALTRGVFTLLAVLFLTSQASAAPILVRVGTLEWLDIDPQGAGGLFSIVNQTGPNYLGDPAFPVVDQLTFTLTLTTDLGPATLNSNIGDPFSFDSDFYAPGGYPMQASLTGTVSPLQVLIDLDGADGNPAALYDILSGIVDGLGISPVILGSGPATIPDGAFQNLYVSADLAATAVPEPATLALLGAGVSALVARRRRQLKSRA